LSNPLEDLGLNLGITEDQAAGTTTAKGAGKAAGGGSASVETPAADKPKAAPRQEVEVGEIEIATEALEALPALTRGGASGSKYPFEKLVAPTGSAEAGYAYSSFTVKLQEGVDEDALKRSVQSATTQANSRGKSTGTRFVTRSINEGGKFVAIKVFRVDGTLGDGE
jgi:hypothetical protein